jgi:cytidyltransferase-like protein
MTKNTNSKQGVRIKMKKINIGMTVGCFDMLHKGHVDLFEQMKKAGADCIIVFLHDDKSIFINKGKFPVQNYSQREQNLIDSGYVSQVLKVDMADPSEIIKAYFNGVKLVDDFLSKIANHFYMRGDDWSEFPGKKMLEKLKIPIKIKKYYEGVSSSKLRDEITKR